MSIWLDATVTLSSKIDPSKSPKIGIETIFKKHGIDFNESHFEGCVKRTELNGDILISICNPDGLVDAIHASFKEIVKQPWVVAINIHQHHYS